MISHKISKIYSGQNMLFHQLLTCESWGRCHVLEIYIYIWWRHQIESFSALLDLCAGNSTVTGEFLSLRSVTRSFHVCLIWALTNGWADNRDGGDLRRYRAYYDSIMMIFNLHKNIPLFIYFIYMDKTHANNHCYSHSNNTVGNNVTSVDHQRMIKEVYWQCIWYMETQLHEHTATSWEKIWLIG